MMSQLIVLINSHVPLIDYIIVLQDYAGAFNNTCFTKEENSVNIMERVTMLLTGKFPADVWLKRRKLQWENNSHPKKYHKASKAMQMAENEMNCL